MPFCHFYRITLERMPGLPGERFACVRQSWVNGRPFLAWFLCLNRSSPLYDRFPFIPSGTREECLVGWDEIVEKIASAPASQMVGVIECYPGVFLNELKEALATRLPDAEILSTEKILRDPREIQGMLEPWLGDDPVFGIMNAVEIRDFL